MNAGGGSGGGQESGRGIFNKRPGWCRWRHPVNGLEQGQAGGDPGHRPRIALHCGVAGGRSIGGWCPDSTMGMTGSNGNIGG